MGRIIQKAINGKFGGGTIFFKGQESISNYNTAQKYLVFNEESFDDIRNTLRIINEKLTPVFEDVQEKSVSRSIVGIKDEIDIPGLCGLVIRTKEFNKKIIERYNRLPPILQSIVKVVQAAVQ